MLPIGFQSETVKAETADGRNFTLLEPLVYVDRAGVIIRIPVGTHTDGASTPAFLWPTVPPFGPHWRATILHDYFYRVLRNPKDQADELLLEAMQLSGVSIILAKIIYEGVKLGGARSYAADAPRHD